MAESTSISPFFARDAAAFLAEGNAQHAIELCVRGTQAYPQYATGHFVLGKCYESLGKTLDALAEYKLALQMLPTNAILQSVVKLAEERQQEEFKKFADDQKQKLNQEQKSLTPQEFVSETQSSEESAIEYLAKRLQDVKRIQPTTPPSGDSLPLRDDRSVKFVTATMAEIYATQGEYSEAIAAYRELVRQHPEDQEKYAARISEIDKLLEIQQSEKKLHPPDSN